jgi:hypothetical protein
MMDRLDPGVVIAGDPEVVGCTLAEGSALLNMRTYVYYSLDEVGAFVWEALREPVPFSRLVEQVCAAFAAPAPQVEADLARLVRQMDKAGLVQCRTP